MTRFVARPLSIVHEVHRAPLANTNPIGMVAVQSSNYQGKVTEAA